MLSPLSRWDASECNCSQQGGREDEPNYLKYAWLSETAWLTATIPGENQGYHASLALDGAGRPHISHYSTESGLMYAWRIGDTWYNAPVERKNVGQYSAIALDSSGDPHISYHAQWPNYNLKYAHSILYRIYLPVVLK
jgi:hypothetical protein